MARAAGGGNTVAGVCKAGLSDEPWPLRLRFLQVHLTLNIMLVSGVQCGDEPSV